MPGANQDSITQRTVKHSSVFSVSLGGAKINPTESKDIPHRQGIKATPTAEQIKRGSTGSMLQEHFMISGTFESETHKNKQPDLIINNIYEYH